MMPGGCTGALAVQSYDTWDWPALRVVRRTLSSGLRVILAENHTVPLVWLGWVSRAGIEQDTPELSGLAVLTPLLLREGSARRSAGQTTGEIEDLGAHLGVGCDWDRAFVSLEMLACDFTAGVDLLLDMACRAQFPQDAVARLKQGKLAELERRDRQPAALADQAFARALYGDGPYGRSPLGTTATLQRIQAADVAAFHAAHYRPETSCFVLAGSFDGDAVEDLLRGLVPTSARVPGAAAATPLSPAAVTDEAAAGVRLVNLPHATRTELRVGHAGVARDNPDLPALQVLAAILGGGPVSRLATSLRQRLGLTYQVRSRFVARRAGGPFVVETNVASGAAGSALAAISREIERLRDEPVPAHELEQTKRRLLGDEIRRFHTILDTGGAFSQVALDDDPVRHFERKRQALAGLEPGALRELARRHLHPERLVAVAAGPAETLQSQFSRSEAPVCRPLQVETNS